MAEFQPSLWAPWRMDYIATLTGGGPACFFCDYRDRPADDADNFVLWRSDKTLVMLNRYPYTNGHVLLAPAAHGGELAGTPEDVLAELIYRTRDVQRVLAAAVHPDGFNIGMNVGRCAGAGLPEHLHFHVVPRWNGDTNFMPVLGNTRVMPQSLESVYDAIVREAARLGLNHR